MPIEVGIWRVDGEKVEPVPTSAFQTESKLEDILEQDISILGLDVLLVIGRQTMTTYGKRVDLLAIDVEGSGYVIELKRDRTPREIVAQALDYGYWVRSLTDDDLEAIFAQYNDAQTLAAARGVGRRAGRGDAILWGRTLMQLVRWSPLRLRRNTIGWQPLGLGSLREPLAQARPGGLAPSVRGRGHPPVTVVHRDSS